MYFVKSILSANFSNYFKKGDNLVNGVYFFNVLLINSDFGQIINPSKLILNAIFKYD